MSLQDLGPLLLVGAGKMGSAMLAGWLHRGLPGGGVTVVEPSPSPELVALAGDAGARIIADVAMMGGALPRVAVLAVKPQAMGVILPAVARAIGRDTVAVSIAAGTTLAGLSGPLGSRPIVRVMPNTPAQIGRGMSVAVANAAASAADREAVTALMEAVGEVAWLDDEALMDAVTAVSGSGPAYVFLLAETLADAGRAAGLPSELAVRLARATVAGSGELLGRSDLDPATLRKNVTSPGGTTAAALSVLMGEDGLGALMTRAVAAAKARGRELGG